VVGAGEDDRAACALEEIVVDHEASVRRGYDNDAPAAGGGGAATTGGDAWPHVR
jgi:hypothetical protein